MKRLENLEKMFRLAAMLAILGLILFACFSCKPQKQITNTVETINTITNYDTTYIIKSDSASRILILKCDSSYNAIVTSDRYINGQRVRIIYKLKNNTLYLNAPVDSMLIFAQYSSSHKETISTNNIVIQPKPEINWWKWAFFGLLTVIFIAFLIMLLIVLRK